jgi:hypothetical protein
LGSTDPATWAKECPDLQQYTDSIVEACGGLPLALRIMGAAMHDKWDPTEWEVRGLIYKTAWHAAHSE